MKNFQATLAKAHKYHPAAAKAFEAKYGGTVECVDTNCNDRGIDAVWNQDLGLSSTIDFKILFNGYRGDIPLEYMQNGQPGCIVDPVKVCDLVAFYWVRKREILIYSGSRLRAAALDNQTEWLAQYGRECADLGTTMAFVPRQVVDSAIAPISLLNGRGGAL